MQVHELVVLAQQGLQESISFATFLSQTYGSGRASLDTLATFTTAVLLYSLFRLITHYDQERSNNTEFEEDYEVIAEALDLASIQISELRYLLLTEFDKVKRELEFVKQERAMKSSDFIPVLTKPSVSRRMTTRLGSMFQNSSINALVDMSRPESQLPYSEAKPFK